jgi:hypothetical protein
MIIAPPALLVCRATLVLDPDVADPCQLRSEDGCSGRDHRLVAWPEFLDVSVPFRRLTRKHAGQLRS